MRKVIAFVMAAVALAASASAQVTGPTYVFVNGTAANADEVNTDFSNIYAAALNRTGGTMTGTLNTLNVLPTVTNASDLGSTSLLYRTAYLRTALVFGQTGGNYTITAANPAAARALSLNDPGGSDAFAYLAATQTLTNKTLTAPVLSGSITGTYTLAGTPTITGPTISSPVFSGSATGTYTLAGTVTITAPAISAPVFSGSATGTYTLAGTPTITAPAISSPVLSGSATGTYTLAGTPTITSPAISNPVFSGTSTGTYTLGGTPSIVGTALTGTTLSSSIVTTSITTLGTIVTAPNVALLNAVNTFTAFGLHTWSAGSNGTQRHVIANTTSGTAAISGLRLDAGTNIFVMDAFSQGYTTSGSSVASSTKLEATGAGGMNFVASNASGMIGLWTVASQRWGVNAAGDWTVGTLAGVADSSGTPTITSGFGSAPTITGRDYAFKIAMGGGAGNTGGVVTFGHSMNSPICNVTAQTGAGGVTTVITIDATGTTMTIAFASGTYSKDLHVICRSF